ncbi:MAG: hypothetical protein WCO65_02095 [bacterium]
MNQLAIINPRNATEKDFVGCTFRTAVRAVIQVADGADYMVTRDTLFLEAAKAYIVGGA